MFYFRLLHHRGAVGTDSLVWLVDRFRSIGPLGMRKCRRRFGLAKPVYFGVPGGIAALHTRATFLGDTFPARDQIGDARCPVHILHGTGDETVPFWHDWGSAAQRRNECSAASDAEGIATWRISPWMIFTAAS